jgi:hypothetical protein
MAGYLGIALLVLIVVAAWSIGWVQARGWSARLHRGQADLSKGSADLQRVTDRACEATTTARSFTASGRWLPNGEPHEHRP